MDARLFSFEISLSFQYKLQRRRQPWRAMRLWRRQRNRNWVWMLHKSGFQHWPSFHGGVACSLSWTRLEEKLDHLAVSFAYIVTTMMVAIIFLQHFSVLAYTFFVRWNLIPLGSRQTIRWWFEWWKTNTKPVSGVFQDHLNNGDQWVTIGLCFDLIQTRIDKLVVIALN